jgi:transcription antitermination factor NusG
MNKGDIVVITQGFFKNFYAMVKDTSINKTTLIILNTGTPIDFKNTQGVIRLVATATQVRQAQEKL